MQENSLIQKNTQVNPKNPLIKRDPLVEYKVVAEEIGGGVEKYYFWILNRVTGPEPYGFGFQKVEKIKDIFSASETSSYWGLVEQRKGLQQEQISKYLTAVGRMIKDMFQILRELRITEERLQYYKDSHEGDESAEMALKGVWIDMVEGGAKNPTSVLGLATQVGFVILPDLFFKLFPKTSRDVDREVDKLEEAGINRKVREVLKRKLKQFMLWKEKTEKELSNNFRFKLNYLRQHYNIIKMYLGWLRPYLRNVRKLQMSTAEKPELVTAFETSEIELELLLKLTKGYENYFPCALIRFKFVTIPHMAYQREYQRGAIHVGKSEISFEAYVCSEEEIEEYKKKQEEEDLELLSSINSAMETLKEDLIKYLEKEIPEEKKEEEKKPFFEKYFKQERTILEPFIGIFHGFGEIFGSFFRIPKFKKKASWKIIDEKKKAENTIKKKVYGMYYVFKKAFGMITE